MGLFGKLFGKKDQGENHNQGHRPPVAAVHIAENEIAAPVSGRVEARENIPDPVFAHAMMGELVGVWPTEGIVYAPAEGIITAAMPHAFGIKAENGSEILVHVGIDTVEMNGDGFEVWAAAGDRVRAGDAVVSFDLAKVREARHPEIVVTVVTNTEDLRAVQVVAGESVSAGDPLMAIER